MEYLAVPLAILAMGLVIWMSSGGPQKIFSERRLTAEANQRAAEANACAEEAKLESKRLDRAPERS